MRVTLVVRMLALLSVRVTPSLTTTERTSRKKFKKSQSPPPPALAAEQSTKSGWEAAETDFLCSEVWHEVYGHDRAHEEHEQDGKRQNAVDGPEADDDAAGKQPTASESERLQSRQAAEAVRAEGRALGGAGAPQRREQRHQSSSRYYPRAVVFPFLVNFLQGRPTQSVTQRPRW